jgi:tetratricopeptide (TPR) repeat protein
MRNLYFSTILFFIIFSASAQDAYFTYNKAYSQFLAGNNEAAITLFTQAINEKPDLADAYTNRGMTYYKLNKLDNAIADFIKDNSYKKDRSSYNLACCYAIQGKKEEAFKYLEQSQNSEYKQLKNTVENDGDFKNLHTDSRWQTLLAKDFYTAYDKVMIEVNEKFTAKDYEGSIQSCDKAIAINNTDKRAISSKAYILSVLNKNEESIAVYDKLTQNDANDFEGYSGKAEVYFKQNKYEQALPLYEKASVKNPYYMPLYQTGMCKYGTNRKADGISDLKKYCEIYPTDDMTLYTCGRFLYDSQRDAEAMIYAEKAIELVKTIPEYYMLRGYLNHVNKNWDAAIADYSKVISMNGNGVGEGYYKRGICRAERYAKTNDPADKKGFCDDLNAAKGLGIEEATQYLKDLCK